MGIMDPFGWNTGQWDYTCLHVYVQFRSSEFTGFMNTFSEQTLTTHRRVVLCSQ